MADKFSSTIVEKENCVKIIKRNLDSWREVVLPINSLLLWKLQGSQGMIFAIPSIMFWHFYYQCPSVLTVISLFGFVLTLLDYFGPIIISTAFKQDSWTAIKERELEDICRSMTECFFSIKTGLHYIREIRTSRRNVYYPVALTCLGLLAWIGSSVNNLLITYLLVLQLLYLPGLLHYGILQRYYNMVMLKVAHVLHSINAASAKKSQ